MPSANKFVPFIKYWTPPHGTISPHSAPFAVLVSTLFPIVLLIICYRRACRRRGEPRPPPSPPGLPIIGNLHQLISSLPHRSLQALSRKHGPLMLLRLGQVPTLVVSSAQVAQEIMTTHDVAFGGRSSPTALRALERGGRPISFTPYGDYWRQAKKACVVHLLNQRKVRAFRPAREEEVGRLVEAVATEAAAGAVNLSKALSSFTGALICRALLGKEHTAERSTMKGIAELMELQSGLLGGFQLDDFFPSLAWLNVVTGKNSKVKRLVGNWYAFLDRIVDGRARRKVEGEAAEDFTDVLLSLHGGADRDFVPSIAEIKVILMDLISAGIDTAHETLEWAMAELVRSPAAMQKLQEEVRDKTGGKPMVTEDEVEQLPFLKATIKETLRLHPPAPFLIPRVTTKPVQLHGYDVPADTSVLINAWALGRDPDSWESPEEFWPERFLESSVDFKGNDFQFIPFGAGRRICPGMQFATTAIELALANLLHRFDWGLPEGMNGEELDMGEATGVTVRRKETLVLVAKPLSMPSC